MSKGKAVFIRGLDKTLYQRFVAKAKESGKTVGDLMNETMRKLIESGRESENVDPHTLHIGGSVHLSKDDILEIYKEIRTPISITNNGNLTLDQDIDREALKYINRIENTGTLRVPKHAHPLVLLKAGRIYGTIEKY